MGHLQKQTRPQKTGVHIGKQTHEMIAAAVAPMPGYRAIASGIYAEILAEAAKHIETGRLESSIKLVQGKVDWRVESDGVDYSWHAEFGHMAGSKGAGTWTWVPGIGAFRKVVARHGGY